MKDSIVTDEKRFFKHFNRKVIPYLSIGVFKRVDKWINSDHKMRTRFVVAKWPFFKYRVNQSSNTPASRAPKRNRSTWRNTLKLQYLLKVCIKREKIMKYYLAFDLDKKRNGGRERSIFLFSRNCIVMARNKSSFYSVHPIT